MTSGPCKIMNLNDFSGAHLQNSKGSSSWSPKFMNDSEVIVEIEGTNFSCGSNIKIEKEFGLQIRERSRF
jgi:hypothetical protein